MHNLVALGNQEVGDGLWNSSIKKGLTVNVALLSMHATEENLDRATCALRSRIFPLVFLFLSSGCEYRWEPEAWSKSG